MSTDDRLNEAVEVLQQLGLKEYEAKALLKSYLSDIYTDETAGW